MEMLARVASMYYLEDMTQDQIATQLGLSRPKVWRLLRQAKETGIVEITVNLPPSLAMPVETELTSRFGLSGAILVAHQHDESAIRAQVGRAAAGLLDRLLPDGGTLSIGMGRNVKAVSQQASGLRPRRCTVVSGIGGSAQVGDGLNSTDIATRFADALGGKAEGIYAPAYAESEDVRDAFLTHADIRRTLAHARGAGPVTGRDIMPTVRAEMHRVLAGHRTATVRTTGSGIWVVYRGSGATVIDGRRFRWTAGDMFVTPSWAAVDHEAADDADLFRFSDAPALEALGLARTEQARQQDIVADDAG